MLSLINSEMQFRVRYHFISTSMAKIKTLIITYVGWDVKRCHTLLVVVEISTITLENSLHFPVKSELHILCNMAVLHLDIFLEKCTLLCLRRCIRVFQAEFW